MCSSRWQQRWAGRELQAPLLSSLVQLSDTLPRSAFSVGSGLEQTYKALFSCHRRGGRDKAPLILGQQSVTDTWLERPHPPKPKDSGPCSLCGSKASGSRGPRLCLCPSGFPFLLLGRGFLPVGVGSAGARPLVLRHPSHYDPLVTPLTQASLGLPELPGVEVEAHSALSVGAVTLLEGLFSEGSMAPEVCPSHKGRFLVRGQAPRDWSEGIVATQGRAHSCARIHDESGHPWR